MRGAIRLTLMACATLSVAACATRAERSRLPQPAGVREFEIPWADAFPGDIVVDDAGRVWFTDRMAHVVGMFDPEGERFTAYATPTRPSAPYGLVRAPDGSLWFAESRAGNLARLDPATGSIVEYPLGISGGPHLLTWSHEAVWFTMRGAATIGRFDPVTGELAFHRAEGQRPYGIAPAAGRIWVGSYETFRLTELDPSTAAMRFIDLAPLAADLPVSGPRHARHHADVRRMAADPRGGFWFSDFGGNRVVHHDPSTGRLRGFASLESSTEPYGITVTGDGIVWWAERATNRVVALDPRTGERLRVELPRRSTIRNLAVDERRRRVWLPLSDVGRLAVIDLR